MLDRFDEICDRYQVLVMQYASQKILDEVLAAIPSEAKESLYALVDWFQKFMTWSKDENLKRFDFVPTLLKTRIGRCGEWAILFTAVLNSIDKRARLVLDFTDHVWTEFYSAIGEWKHIDSTLTPSQAIDNPFIYQDQWHKNLTKIIAFEPNMPPEDVTARYKH